MLSIESRSKLGVVTEYSFIVSVKGIHSPYKNQTTQEKQKSLEFPLPRYNH